MRLPGVEEPHGVYATGRGRHGIYVAIFIEKSAFSKRLQDSSTKRLPLPGPCLTMTTGSRLDPRLRGPETMGKMGNRRNAITPALPPALRLRAGRRPSRPGAGARFTVTQPRGNDSHPAMEGGFLPLFKPGASLRPHCSHHSLLEGEPMRPLRFPWPRRRSGRSR
ncbi:MAG: hypothetical protein OXU61_08015 [Gammaproteobacteria bacterium]|nr:hypothetical protein [Gammaproteobacteria bacterium]